MAKARLSSQEEIIEVWAKDPNVQAFTDLMNRALGKPATQETVTMSAGIDIRWKDDLEDRLAKARKRLPEARRHEGGGRRVARRLSPPRQRGRTAQDAALDGSPPVVPGGVAMHRTRGEHPRLRRGHVPQSALTPIAHGLLGRELVPPPRHRFASARVVRPPGSTTENSCGAGGPGSGGPSAGGRGSGPTFRKLSP